MHVTNKFAILLALFLTLGITTAAAASVSPANQDGVTTPEYTAAGETTEYELAVTLSDMSDGAEFEVDALTYNLPEELHFSEQSDVSVDDSNYNLNYKNTDDDSEYEQFTVLTQDFDEVTVSPNLTTTSTSTEGSYTVNVEVSDNYASSIDTADLTTKVDDTKPSSTASVTSPSTEDTNDDGTWTLEANSISDSGDISSGVSKITLRVKAPGSEEYEEYNTVEDPSDSATFDFTPESGDGIYKFRSVAVDEVDNEESVSGADDSITLDTQSPDQVSVLQHEDSDANSGFDNDGDVKFSWDEAEDDGQAGIDRYEVRYSTDGGDLDQSAEVEAGTTQYTVDAENGDQVQVEVWAVDNAGNSGDGTTSDTVTVDTENPGNPTSVSVTTAPINKDNDEEVDAQVTLPDDHESGIVELRFGESQDFKFDKHVEAESDEDSQGHQISFTGLGLSNLADSESLSVDARFVDDAGNVNTDGFTQDITVVKDTQRPDPSISFSANPVDEEDLTQEVTVEFGEAMDTSVNPEISIEDVETTSKGDGSWSADGTTWTETFDVSDNDEEVTASATVTGAEDDAGNLQVEEGSANVADFSVDTKVSIDSVQHSFDGSDDQYKVTVEAAGESLDSPTISVDVDGENKITTLNDFESTGEDSTYTDTYDVSEGVENYYKATLTGAEDDEGNSLTGTESTGEIEIDTNPPEVSQSAITTDITTDDLEVGVANPGDVITVEWDDSSNGDDNPDVTSVRMDLSAFGCKSSETASDADEEGVWTADCTVKEDAEGGIDSTGLQASVTAKDNVGNSKTTTDDATISVDNTVPAKVSSLEADRFADSDGAGIELNWDSVTEVDQHKVERKQGSEDWTEIKSVSSTSYQDYDVSNAEEYDYRVRAVDNAENKGEYSSTESETADTEAPKVTSAETISTTEIEVTLSDDVSGLDVSTIEAGDFATSSGDVTDISGQDAEDGAGSTTFTVETGSFDRGETPDVKIVSEASGISDVTGNNRDGYTYSNTKDGVPPQKPEGISFDSEEYINSDEASSAGITVDLPSNIEGGTVEVRVSNGNNNPVSTSTGISSGESEASVSPDISGLSEGQLDLEAWIVDDASSENDGEHLENTDAAELDTTAPTFDSAEVVDKGSIDVIFKGDINGNTVSGDAFDIEDPYGVEDYDVDGETVELTLEEELQTGATPEVTVNPESVSDKGITDAAGNAVEMETREASDELSPEIQSVTTYDVEDGVAEGETEAGKEGDGTVNGAIVKFTEQLESVDSSELDFGNHVVSGAELMEDSSKMRVELTKEIEGTGATPVLNLDPEAVQDDAGNNLEAAKSIRSSDGASPVLMSSEVNQDESDSDSTVLDLSFSEFVRASPDASATLSPAEGTLQFSEQTGTTLQATYHDSDGPAVLNTGEVYEETEGEETEMTEPEVEAFTGVEDVDHYREAGANLSDYSKPSSPEHTVSTVEGLRDRWDDDGSNEASSNDVILLESGTYTLSNSLDGISVTDLTIAGAGANQTTLEVQDNRINRPASGFTLKGMEVSSTGGEAIYSASSVTVDSVRFTTSSGNPTDAIGPKVKNTKLVVRNSVFDGLKHGVFLNSADDSTIESSTFLGGYSTSSGSKYGTGIKITGSAGNVSGISIKDNLIKDQGAWDGDVIDGYTAGIEVEELANTVSSITIESNDFENNHEDVVAWDPTAFGGDGSWNSSYIDATDNYFGSDGIQVQGGVDASYTTLNSGVNSQGTDIRTFTRTLSDGSNMVSFPINQGTMDAGSVTEDLENLKAAWTYQNGEWKEVATGDGGEFRGGLGYIFNMDGQETLSVNVDHEFQTEISGNQPSSPVSYNATAGWNLLGSLEEYDQSTGDAMSSLENAAGDKKYEVQNNPSEIQTGHAYWTLMKEDGVYANAE